jgi:hypothetical protein
MIMLLSYRQLKRPSLMAPGKALYMRAPASLEEKTRDNLLQPLGNLISSGTEITVTDEALPATSLRLLVQFE